MPKKSVGSGLAATAFFVATALSSVARAGNPLGAACMQATECTSGHCTDGVCCEVDACGAGLTCSPVPICSVGGATTTNPEPGKCRLLLGTACDSSNAAQCPGGASHCVDGVCCFQDASACNPSWGGPCVSCNVPTASGGCLAAHGVVRGFCGFAPAGPPPSDRTCAAPSGADPACAGHFQCVGTAVCGMPAGVVCKSASCEGSAGTPASTCDAAGRCVTPSAQACAPYACDAAGRCLGACSGQKDCAGGFLCAAGTCVAQTGGQCSDDLTASIAKDGTRSECGAYRCDASGGACRDHCSSTDDCAAGGNCDVSSGRCTAAVASPDSGGCNNSAGPAAPAAIWGVTLLALGLAERRARRGR